MSLVTHEDAVILHFHSERKVNPDDSTDIEWIEKRPVVLLLHPDDDSELLEYILDRIEEIEHMTRADYVTHQRGA